MPGEIIGELLIRPIAELILHIVGYYTSRILLPIFSFGHIFVAPSPKGIKVKPKWHGFGSASNGKIVVHEEMGTLLGLLIWAAFITIGFIIYSNWS